jgi:hypothetical protein
LVVEGINQHRGAVRPCRPAEQPYQQPRDQPAQGGVEQHAPVEAEDLDATGVGNAADEGARAYQQG